MLDKERTEQLFQQCYNRLLQLAEHYLNDEEEARDAVSDVFARIAGGTLQLPQDKPESYLLVCVRNECFSHIRKLSVRERLKRNLTMDTESVTSVETEEERLQELMAYAEQTLTPQTWHVFLLRFDEGLKYREIAKRLSISEFAVYKHLAQALRQLRNNFKNETK